MLLSKSEMADLRRGLIPVVTRYVRERVLPTLVPGAITAPSFRFEIPERGHKSVVFILAIDGHDDTVLRADLRGRRLRRRIRGHEELAAAGLSVPKVLHADLTRETKDEYGYRFIIEEVLRGVHLDEAPDKERVATLLGQDLARAHRIRKPHFGWIGAAESSETFAGRHRESIEKWLRSVSKSRGYDSDRVRRVLGSIAPEVWDQSPRLTVGQGIGSKYNLMVTEDRVGLIDLSGVRAGSAQIERARVRYRLLLDVPGAWEVFDRAYRANADADLLAECDRGSKVAAILVNLEEAARRKKERWWSEHLRVLDELTT